jgi:membrane fusion protein (multidrug efflux system)
VHLKAVTQKSWVVYFACSLLLLGCGSDEEVGPKESPKKEAPAASKPRGLPVKAEQVHVGQLTDSIFAVGSILANESVIIRPEISGRIKELKFSEGQAVKKGQPLVLIDDSEHRAQLAAVNADLRTETQRYTRSKELYEKKFISKEALDLQAGSVDRLAAEVAEMKARLSKTEIVAPFSGLVGLRKVSPGAFLRSGDDIVSLQNVDSVKIDFRVPEVFLRAVKVAQTVSISVDAFPETVFSGKVYAIEPLIDEQTRTVLVRGVIKNDSGKLKPGMYARVSLEMSARENVISIPESALWPQGTENFVFKVVEGAVALTKVELGTRQPGSVEIVSGLSDGDMIVTDGQIKLRDGAPVMVMGAAEPKAN